MLSVPVCASERPGEVWFELPTLGPLLPESDLILCQWCLAFLRCSLTRHFLFRSVLFVLYLFLFICFDVGFHWVAQVGLELVAMLLLQPPEHWDCNPEPTQTAAGSFTELSYSITPMPLISSSLCSVEPGRLCELQPRQGREIRQEVLFFFFLSCESNLPHNFYMGYSLSLIKVIIKIKSQIKTSKENESLEI